MTVTHKLVLCADDYALTDGVSRGILELARLGRISATSAMTNMPAWPTLAGDLRNLGGRLAVGLHLNVTTGRPLAPMPRLAPDRGLPPLDALLRRALMGRLPMGEVREEIERQLAAFEQALGRPPDFVDGHQHAHVLPGIRGALLQALQDRGLQGRLWLRDPSDSAAAILRRGVSSRKAVIVKALAFGFRAAARRAGFDTNEGFSGYSPLDLGTRPETVFGKAFIALGPRPVVMAHPGYSDEALRTLDSDVESREHELAYLGSPAFEALLRERGIALVERP